MNHLLPMDLTEQPKMVIGTELLFFDTIAYDASGSNVKSDPSHKLLGHGELKKMEPVDFFNYFMPWTFFQDHIILETSQALQECGSDEISMHEMKTWLGNWFLMSPYGQYSIHDFFDAKEKTKKSKRTDFWNPPKCDRYMSRGCFKNSTMVLTHKQRGPQLMDK